MNSPQTERLLEGALEAFRRGAWAEAEHALTGVLALDPDDANAWFLRGRAKYLQIPSSFGSQTRELTEPLADFDRALALAPRAAAVYLARASCREVAPADRSPDHPFLVANLADLEQATALVPDDPLAWSERAVAEERLGRCDAALRSYTRALTLEPSIETYSDRAQFYLDTGDVPAAIADLTAAIGLPQTERHDSLRRQRAELLLEHRDFRAAREAFAELAGIVPDDAEAARGLADAAQALNDDDAAALRERADALEERWRADLASGRAGARYPLAARILGLPIADEPAD